VFADEKRLRDLITKRALEREKCVSIGTENVTADLGAMDFGLFSIFSSKNEPEVKEGSR
jgi:hypothetical protein